VGADDAASDHDSRSLKRLDGWVEKVGAAERQCDTFSHCWRIVRRVI
jgi:hypothetical protein